MCIVSKGCKVKLDGNEHHVGRVELWERRQDREEGSSIVAQLHLSSLTLDRSRIGLRGKTDLRSAIKNNSNCATELQFYGNTVQGMQCSQTYYVVGPSR